jgi:hypothetical protein
VLACVKIPERLQCTPEVYTEKQFVRIDCRGALPGMYRGFTLRGKPHGRGEWTADEGLTYAGDWQEGAACGYGKETSNPGYTYEGEFRDGAWHGKGVAVHSSGTPRLEGIWVEGCQSSGVRYLENGQVVRGEFWKGWHGGNTWLDNWADKYWT